MIALLSFIAVIVLVVSVHEYGHYLAARWFKVRVLRFSVGFGKPLLSRQDAHGTVWTLAPILLGGYVRLLDRDSARELNLPAAEGMEARPPWQRIVIYAAGPLANLLLSLGITLLLLAGGQQGLRPLVDEVRTPSAAASAGLRAGEEITHINGDPTPLWQQVESAFTDGILRDTPLTVHTASGGVYPLPVSADHLPALEAHGSGALALGILPSLRHIKLTLATVMAESPAARGGLRSGDVLVMMDDTVLEHWHDAVSVIEQNAARAISVIVWREDAALTLTVTPAESLQGGRTHGYLGVAPVVDREALRAQLVTVTYSPVQWVAAAVAQTGADITRALTFLKLLFSARISNEHISGPVGIAVQSGEAASLGAGVWLRFVTLISTSLGILNLLPLPLLDGGQIILNMIEWARRRELAEHTLRLWNICGALTIFTLMAFVILNDLVRLL